MSVVWIRYLISYLDRINEIFFARDDSPFGRKPFYLDNPVNPVEYKNMLKASIPL